MQLAQEACKPTGSTDCSDLGQLVIRVTKLPEPKGNKHPEGSLHRTFPAAEQNDQEAGDPGPWALTATFSSATS